MLYDTARNKETAIRNAKIYVDIHGWESVDYGQLIPEDSDRAPRWAVELPARRSPKGKIADMAREVGPGYTFKKIGTVAAR